MARHYFFFGSRPPLMEAYHPPQKLACTSAMVLGALTVLTGFAGWKPVQLSWLAWIVGGFHRARLWNFIAMWALLAFVLGHIVMGAIHGWNNFVSMLTSWKKEPEYRLEKVPEKWRSYANDGFILRPGTDAAVGHTDRKPVREAAHPCPFAPPRCKPS
jgi:cytochrome b subunit of formate dehydrogenase